MLLAGLKNVVGKNLAGTNLRKIDAQIVSEVVKRINHRSRKVLNFRTPHEVFYMAVRGAPAT
jgi:IS30 family transposase